MADRRMIWRNVSFSEKVNKLSLKAALLWTWAIPFFDVKGFIEVDPGYLKAMIVPRRKDIKESEIPKLLDEIFTLGLWLRCETSNSKSVAHDPKFHDFQKIRESHEGKSQLAEIVTNIINYSSATVELPHSVSGSGSVSGSVSIRKEDGRDSSQGDDHDPPPAPTKIHPSKRVKFNLETAKFEGLEDEDLFMLREKYPLVSNLKLQLKEIEAFWHARPTNAKHKKDWWKTICNRLRDLQEKMPAGPPEKSTEVQDGSSLDPYEKRLKQEWDKLSPDEKEKWIQEGEKYVTLDTKLRETKGWVWFKKKRRDQDGR